MPFKIEIDRSSQTVILRVSGREELDKHREICDKAVQECFDNGFKRFLTDLRNVDTSNITSLETGLEFSDLFAHDERLNGVKIAQVLPTEIISRVDIDFAASIAETKGKTMGRFKTIEAAINWLKE
jgi:hypothetical protein